MEDFRTITRLYFPIVPRFRMLVVKRYGLNETLFACVRFLANVDCRPRKPTIQEQSQVVPRSCMLRVSCEGLDETLLQGVFHLWVKFPSRNESKDLGLVPAGELPLRQTQIVPRVGMSRVKPDGLLEALLASVLLSIDFFRAISPAVLRQ